MNVYARKYSHPRRVNPNSSTVKRYVYDESAGAMKEIPLTREAATRKAKGRK